MSFSRLLTSLASLFGVALARRTDGLKNSATLPVGTDANIQGDLPDTSSLTNITLHFALFCPGNVVELRALDVRGKTHAGAVIRR